ncbi:MAG TPA: helix-turn-helix domain-containing protein [Thermotogota bacterium]|nr:helix-turn-helix domain-containing protein [Thermotogota bacterium]
MEKLLFNVEEAAEMLSISPASLFRVMKAGGITPVRLNGRTLFNLEEIRRVSREGFTLYKKKEEKEC